MGNESSEYLPLAASPQISESEYSEENVRFRESKPGSHRRSRTERVLILALILQSAVLFFVVLLLYKKSPNGAIECNSPERDNRFLYSPAQGVVEYEVKSFTAGREHKTKYQGMSDEVDAAWEELYDGLLIQIPKNEAALLPNKTWPIKENPGYYIGGLDVFHQLHCLNNVRRALNRNYYANDTDLDEEHVSHCIDTIRQSLMCNADISVNVWQWSEELKAVVGYSTQAHTCRNFEKLQQWSAQHRLDHWIDIFTFVEDDLPDPPVYY